MRGYRKLLVAMTVIVAVTILCIGGWMDGGAAAGVMGTVATVYLGANAVIHRAQGGTSE